MKLTGAAYSGTRVTIGNAVKVVSAPFIFCTIPDADAGSDKALNCINSSVILDGSSAAPSPPPRA